MRLRNGILPEQQAMDWRGLAEWFRVRLATYAGVAAGATAVASIVLAALGPRIDFADKPPMPATDVVLPPVGSGSVPADRMPRAPIDEAMVVANGLGRGKFVALPVDGASVIDGAGNTVGQIRQVVIGDNGHVVAIVVRKPGRLFSAGKDVIVPSGAYRFRNDENFPVLRGGQNAGDVAAIQLSGSQFDGLPSVESTGK